MKLTLIAAIIAATIGTVISIPLASHEALVNHTTTHQGAYWDGQQFQPVIVTVVQQ